MIDLALDASETRATRGRSVRPGGKPALRPVLLGLAGVGALGGFALATASLMADLAAPAPAKFVSSGRAADWPDLKDGLPALAQAEKPASQPEPAEKPAEPAATAMRVATLPDKFVPPAGPAKAAAAPAPAPQAAAMPPSRRLPVPTPVVPVAAGRPVVPLPPARTATLQPPRAAETVRARETTAASAAPKPVAAVTPAASSPEKIEKPARKAAAAHKAPAPVKAAEKPRSGATTSVAQADAPEETELLGIKLPSLAPAGRKLKESVDALGEAVKSVF